MSNTKKPKETAKKTELSTGVMTFISLLILTAVEYGVSFLESASIALFVIALFKAGLILNYFMHMAHLWGKEAHE